MEGTYVPGQSRIFEILDRVLCNDEWRLKFPDAMAWSESHPLPSKVKQVEEELLQWKEHEIIARIGGIQRRQHASTSNKFLNKLERKLQDELDTVLKQEEMVWYQKSRAQWIKDAIVILDITI
ncbi:hypothetical protein TSUD_279380 [Trifolium subterraneum]|uniref:Uncharacterized protein n=1 Tax=Trifolium subterraneum TaxID=3900 RepID=A0A2Z6ML41_TRISU|nr:hypothetical protein TSUD_279380 [Trifolium subterraneum]